MVRTYKCRVKLSKSGHEKLSRVFQMCADIYNACLEERIDCYRKTGKSRTYYDQCKALTEVRADDPEYAGISVQVFRGAVGRIDKAFKSFYRRVEKKEKPGFPRFKKGETVAHYRDKRSVLEYAQTRGKQACSQDKGTSPH